MNDLINTVRKPTFSNMTRVMMATVFSLGMVSMANAGLDEKIAASFAAKYDVCSKRLSDKGMRIRAIKLKAEANRIGREKVGGGGYIKALVKEKKKAWLIPIKKCKRFADNL